MTADDLKKAAAKVAIERVQDGAVLGVGTGSTVNHFIDMLPDAPQRIAGAVSSSEASTRRLVERGIPVISLDELIAGNLPMPVYVDGADEIDPSLAMIKGGGGALTREKIIAQAADRFVCIVDQSKLVTVLGAFPLPVEVIPMAAGLVAQRLRQIGGEPVLRAGFVTDNGNSILDVAGLRITDPVTLERDINQWPGVVTVGLFAQRGADECLIAGADGVSVLTAQSDGGT